MPPLHLAGLPAALSWLHHPVAWTVESGDQLTIQAGAATDWFSDPTGSPQKDDAPCALFASSDKEFTLSAHVRVAFASTFDAGTLQLRVPDAVWPNLSSDYTP